MWNPQTARQQDSPPQTPINGRLADERRTVAWVGKSVIFKGDLISSEDMTIDGRVEGSIELRDHTLTIGPDADIRANIIARAVTIFGSVTGSINAANKVDIRETGSVEGDINSPKLAIADGAHLRGRVDTGAAQEQKEQRPRPVAVN
jgi:cytoskeletal protein CcmA (bactofilin family)